MLAPLLETVYIFIMSPRLLLLPSRDWLESSPVEGGISWVFAPPPSRECFCFYALQGLAVKLTCRGVGKNGISMLLLLCHPPKDWLEDSPVQ